MMKTLIVSTIFWTAFAQASLTSMHKTWECKDQEGRYQLDVLESNWAVAAASKKFQVRVYLDSRLPVKITDLSKKEAISRSGRLLVFSTAPTAKERLMLSIKMNSQSENGFDAQFTSSGKSGRHASKLVCAPQPIPE
jgi:hypothetical protein